MSKRTAPRRKVQQMSLFVRFIVEGNEKADELAKEGAMMDVGVMAQVRAIKVQQEREHVYATLQDGISFHCLVEEWKESEELKPKRKEKWTFVDRRVEAKRHRTEWCAAASRYRCMKCEKTPNTSWEDGANCIWEGTTW